MTDPTDRPPAPGIVDLHPRLQAGETLYGTFAGLGSPVATELIARAGFDWLIVDLEHGAGTKSELLASLHAMGATSTAALVRPHPGSGFGRPGPGPGGPRDHGPAGRPPGAGSRGDLVHALSTRRRARARAVDRGAGLGEIGHGDVRAINRRLLGIIQIESPAPWSTRPNRRHRRGRRPVRRSDRPGASLGVPGRFDDPGYLAALAGSSRPPKASARRPGPFARRRGPATASRPRVPVHRARLRRGVHHGRRSRGPRRRPRLTRGARRATHGRHALYGLLVGRRGRSATDHTRRPDHLHQHPGDDEDTAEELDRG